jgi:hypothetical protein
MGRLERWRFLEELTGKTHFTHYGATARINPQLASQTPDAGRCGIASPISNKP